MKQLHHTLLREPCNGDVIISIRHKFAEQIYDGTKVLELRHIEPTIKPGSWMWIYEPKPIGMITGYVRYDGLLIGEPKTIWKQYHEFLGVSEREFFDYYSKRKQAFAWCVGLPYKLYDPIPLAYVGITRPPQSYQYLRTIQEPNNHR